MKKEVLFLLLNEYADWEGAYLASTLNAGVINLFIDTHL